MNTYMYLIKIGLNDILIGAVLLTKPYIKIMEII